MPPLIRTEGDPEGTTVLLPHVRTCKRAAGVVGGGHVEPDLRI